MEEVSAVRSVVSAREVLDVDIEATDLDGR